MRFGVRSAHDDDAAAIVALLNPIIDAGRYTIMDEPVTIATQLDYLRGRPERSVNHVAVCVETGRVLGVQSVEPLAGPARHVDHVGDISTFVALDAQRRGVGRALTAATVDAAAALGFVKIMAMIRADNPAALAFYRGQGFTVVGTARRHARVRGTLVDEVLTERLLERGEAGVRASSRSR